MHPCLLIAATCSCLAKKYLNNMIYSWLEMKAILVSKNRKVAMKSKRKWKKYWGKTVSSYLAKAVILIIPLYSKLEEKYLVSL